MEVFDWSINLRKLQVEVSSYCNAQCGACIRNKDGGEMHPWLQLQHIDMSIWERLVYTDTAGVSIEKLTLNGNVGDPGMNPNLPEMMRMYTEAHPETTIYIATNGSMQSTDWWENLGTALYQSAHHTVQFAMDGLADTHAIYRRKTDWHKLCDNIRAFANTGRAQIITTLFDHNVHQIDQIHELAEELGCVHFVTRYSVKDKITIKTAEENYTITTDLVDSSMIRNVFLTADEKPLSLNEKAKKLRIDSSIMEHSILNTKCPWYNMGEVQILSDGRVFPCCHISGDFYIDDPVSLNLKDRSLIDILDDKWYTDTIPKAISNAKWSACRNVCGVCAS